VFQKGLKNIKMQGILNFICFKKYFNLSPLKFWCHKDLPNHDLSNQLLTKNNDLLKTAITKFTIGQTSIDQILYTYDTFYQTHDSSS